MLFVLSPAKSLNMDPAPPQLAHSQPLFAQQAAALMKRLKALSPQQLAALMGISDKLAALNTARHAAWSAKSTAHNAKQAVLAFDGDVYDGLAAATLDAPQLDWAQQHLCILSGLYGVLRPLDWMQPYRLEMGTRLDNAQGADLYAFWGRQIADHLNQRLAATAQPVLVNLASQEYFKAVDTHVLKARVVECVFQDSKNGADYKIVSFYAKRARGLMARYAIEQRATRPEQLQGFAAEGYAWAKAASSADRLVFRRKAGHA